MITRKQRRSARLPHFDYTSPGAYFVTVCAYRRQLLFQSEQAADVIKDTWSAIPNHFRNTFVDAFVVMPNHVHGIVFIDDAVGAQHAAPLPDHAVVAKGSLGAIVRSFKSAATKRLRELGLSGDGYLWQRNYYERIVRNEGELNRIREYIAYNPYRWHLDYEDPHREPDPKHDLDWAWLEDHTSGAT